jgi:homoserine kinase
VISLEPGRRVTVEVPATSANLGPGFDCFGLALSWRDQVELAVTEGGFVVDVTGESADAVPRDASHLILRSALRGLADLDHSVPGLRLRCHGTIPHGRGLGSSSAAIVAGLLAAAALVRGPQAETVAGRRWALQHATAIEGHPDNVAAAVHGGFVLAWGGADGVEVATSPVHPDVAATVFVPSTPVATKAARGLLPPSVPHRDAARNAGRAALLVHALANDPDHLLAGTADWLHQDQRRPAMPDSWTLMSHLRGLGHAAVISGAGPTVLVLGRAAELQGLEVQPLGFRRVPLAIGAGAAVTHVDGKDRRHTGMSSVSHGGGRQC